MSSFPLIRAVHVVTVISEKASGLSNSVLRQCESLIAQGQAISLAALDWAPMPSPPSFLRTFPLGLGPRRLGRSPAMKQWLMTQAGCRSVDLFHSHSLWMMPSVYSCQVARQHEVPLVVSPCGALSERAFQSGSRLKRYYWTLVQKPALAAVTCFHAKAESEYQDIRRVGLRQPVAIIPNSIDIPPAKEKPRDEVRTLLFLGRIHPIKGVDTLLRGWQVVSPRFREWRLRIVGPDNSGYLPRMQTLAAKLGLERVEFNGPLFGEDKHNAYREADLFVLPTHSENFGTSVAEALSVGTPVIVTKGAPWSGVETRGAGWWIDMGQGPLDACLELALSQPRETLQTMGEQGRKWMQEKCFSRSDVTHKMMETYRWILTGMPVESRPDWIRID
jgi:glycosyltransferase involved in cell wall biosynthesis